MVCEVCKYKFTDSDVASFISSSNKYKLRKVVWTRRELAILEDNKYKPVKEICDLLPKKEYWMVANKLKSIGRDVPTGMKCPDCGFIVDGEKVKSEFGSMGGKSTSKKKVDAARNNGRKGGRPTKEEVLRRKHKLGRNRLQFEIPNLKS